MIKGTGEADAILGDRERERGREAERQREKSQETNMAGRDAIDNNYNRFDSVRRRLPCGFMHVTDVTREMLIAN